MSEPDVLTGLPGEPRMRRALADARAGRWTDDALLVAIAPSRLRALGLEVPETVPDQPELALHARLAASGHADPFAYYNSLVRELDAFLEALESRRGRELQSAR